MMWSNTWLLPSKTYEYRSSGASVVISEVSAGGVLTSVEIGGENSKSLKAPASTTRAVGSAVRMLWTNGLTTFAWASRWSWLLSVGGWNRPNSGWSPPFEFQ